MSGHCYRMSKECNERCVANNNGRCTILEAELHNSIATDRIEKYLQTIAEVLKKPIQYEQINRQTTSRHS